MAYSPAFQFYPTDYLGDKNTIPMTTEENGAYCLLMWFCWENDGLADDMDELADLARLPVERFTPMWNRRIRKCFEWDEKKKRFFHPRLLKEIKKQKSWKKQKSEAGKIGMAKRWKERGKSDNTVITPLSSDITDDNSPSLIPSLTLPIRKEEIREASATPIAPAERPSDPRKNHPAIVAIHEAAGIYPPKDIWDDIIDQLGVDINQVKLKRCFVKWRARGYNKTNYEGVIDWYLNGIPEAGRSNGTTNRNQQPRRDTTADRLAATADIISQYPSEAELRGQR